MNMRHVFIINPAAGRHDKTGEIVAAIEKVCKSRLLEYDIYITSHAGHASEIVRKTAENLHGSVRFYACGGDGTLNEVVCGAAESGGICEFTSYPVGTGNDYVKMFPGGKQAFLNLENLVSGKAMPVDYIHSDCGCAINVLSIGMDAQVAMRKDKYRFLGTGILPYALAAAESVIKGIGREYYVSIGGECYGGSYSMIFVGNGKYYGGGFCPVPQAKIDDGLLDVLLVKTISKAKAAAVVNKYKQGKIDELRDYIIELKAKNGVVFSRDGKDMCINLDGEIISSARIAFRVIEKSLLFARP